MFALCAASVSCTRIGAACELISCDRPSNAVSCSRDTLRIFLPETVICACTTPYGVSTASPAILLVADPFAVDEVVAGDRDPGRGGAAVPESPGLGVVEELLVGTLAGGRTPNVPTVGPWDLKLSSATTPRTVPVIESNTRFIRIRPRRLECERLVMDVSARDAGLAQRALGGRHHRFRSAEEHVAFADVRNQTLQPRRR